MRRGEGVTHNFEGGREEEGNKQKKISFDWKKKGVSGGNREKNPWKGRRKNF